MATICDRCNNVVNVKPNSDTNTPFINKIHGEILNSAGKACIGFADTTFYICDDCWNDFIDFIKKGEKVGGCKKPVTFIEALKSGKKVNVKHKIIDDRVREDNDFFREYYDEYAPMRTVLQQITNCFIFEGDIRDLILKGEWYIEDEED